MKKVRSKGVTIFGWMVVVGAIFQMFAILSAGYEYYYYLHQEYNSVMLCIRFLFSWFIKIVALILGIGILDLNELSRKITLYYFLFIIATVNLKHTYPAYSLHTKDLDRAIGWAFPNISFIDLTWPALICQRAFDVIFGVALIYFFTRPEVLKQFKN